MVEFLSRHPQVERVNHPSLSGHPDHKLYEKYFPKGAASIFTFEIKGEEKEAQAFIDHLELFSLLANVADVKSLVIHPATTTHAQLSREAQLKAASAPTPSGFPSALSILTISWPTWNTASLTPNRKG